MLDFSLYIWYTYISFIVYLWECVMLKIKRLDSRHPFAANSYLISSEGEYAVVDPTSPYDSSLIEGRLKYVLLTHAHFDHILEVESWAMAGATVIIHTEEKAALSDSVRNCYKAFLGVDKGYYGEAVGIMDGEIISLGNTQIKMMSCPGHTIGSAAYISDDCAFVGDTVFAGGGYGRFDLPTGNFIMLRESIIRLASLPESVIFYPGHGESTTVKQFKQDIGV